MMRVYQNSLDPTRCRRLKIQHLSPANRIRFRRIIFLVRALMAKRGLFRVAAEKRVGRILC